MTKMLAIVSTAFFLADTGTAGTAVTGRQSVQASVTATVQAIDYNTREVTLKGSLGNVVTFTVDKRVARLNEIKVGDEVTADYYVSIAGEARPATEAEKANPIQVLQETAKAPAGTEPAAGALRVIRVGLHRRRPRSADEDADGRRTAGHPGDGAGRRRRQPREAAPGRDADRHLHRGARRLAREADAQRTELIAEITPGLISPARLVRNNTRCSLASSARNDRPNRVHAAGDRARGAGRRAGRGARHRGPDADSPDRAGAGRKGRPAEAPCTERRGEVSRLGRGLPEVRRRDLASVLQESLFRRRVRDGRRLSQACRRRTTSSTRAAALRSPATSASSRSSSRRCCSGGGRRCRSLGGWREATEVGFLRPRQSDHDRRPRPTTASSSPTRPRRLRPGRAAACSRNGAARDARRPRDFAVEADSPARGNAPSIETVYTPDTLPGVGASPTYLHTQGTIGLDWRPAPGYARRGGFYGVTFHDFSDTDGALRLQPDRLRGHAARADPARSLGALVSWPRRDDADEDTISRFRSSCCRSIGGGSDLRGFPSWRFRDRNSLLLQAEWRVIVNRFLDMAVFYDAGKVAATHDGINLNGLKSDYGLGFRMHGPMATPLRIDFAKGREGLRPSSSGASAAF